MPSASESPANLGIVIGLALGILGIAAYVLSDFASVTALIPSVFGVLIVGLGLLARAGRQQRLALYTIGALAGLGIIGSLRAIPDILAQVWTVGTISQGLMIVLSLILISGIARFALATE